MPINNPWLNPFQRSYNEIKSKLLVTLRERVPEMTDTSEGNIFILILDIFAAIAEVLHYYIDGMAREAFLTTCLRYSSLYKHAKLVDYHIKSAVPAGVDLTIYMTGNNIPFPTEIIVPQNTGFQSMDGKQWVTTRTIIIPKGLYTYKIPVSQQEVHSEVDLGTYTSHNLVITLGDLPTGKKYVEGSMVLTIGSSVWTIVETFAYSGPGDRVFKVELDTALKPYIIFGDGQRGRRPDIGSNIKAVFYLTFGLESNIPANQFTKVPEELLKITSGLLITNTSPATGGSDYEDFDTLKAHIPLSVKTLGVAITKEDYESVAMMIPGVDKAYCNYKCGKYVEIYITPDGGSEASGDLINKVYSQMLASKVLTTRVSVFSTHQAKIFLTATITGNKSFKALDISNQVKSALLEAYNYQTSNINRPVRQSDLYAKIDNQPMVDFLTIDELYLLPYPIALKPNTSDTEEVSSVPALNVTYFKMVDFITSAIVDDFENSYIKTVVEEGKTYYQIYPTKDLAGVPLFTGTYGKPLDVKLAKSKFIITINSPVAGASYENGSIYQLTVQPMGTGGRLVDLVPHNYNIPIFDSENIKLIINEVV